MSPPFQDPTTRAGLDAARRVEAAVRVVATAAVYPQRYARLVGTALALRAT